MTSTGERAAGVVALVAAAQFSLISLGWFISEVFSRMGERSLIYRAGPVLAATLAGLSFSRLAGLTYLKTLELSGRLLGAQESPGK